MSMTEAPIFPPPPLCVVPLKETVCSGFGYSTDCYEAYKADSPFGKGIILGHAIVFVCLIVIGFANLFFYYNGAREIWGQSMVLTSSFYAILTSSFALCRSVWMLSRPLFIGAAMHNFFEWCIVIQLSFNTVRKQRKYVVLATAFILVIISLVSLVPDLKAVTLLEQSCGVMLDLGLPLMFLRKWIYENRQLYRLPALAHSIHFVFTILPLIFANFFVGEISWVTTFGLEFLIYVSTPITHILYLIWSVEFDNKKRIQQDRDMAKRRVSRDEANTLENADVLQRPEKYLFISFFLGLIPLVVIPNYILSPCPSDKFCKQNPTVFRTTSVNVYDGFGRAFQDRIAHYKLIENGTSARGNKKYELTKSISNPTQYNIFEEWASEKDYEAWVEGGLPSQVFRKDGPMGDIINGSMQAAGYRKPAPSSCHDEVHVGFFVDVKSSCRQVWSVITNFENDCSWIQDCLYVSTDPQNPKIRNLTMVDGEVLVQKLLYVKHDEFGYQLLPGSPALPGYKGVVTRTRSKVPGMGCGVGFKYQLHKGNFWEEQVESMYTTQQRSTIPYIRHLFANPGSWVDPKFEVEIVNGYIRHEALSGAHSSLANAARLNAPSNISKVQIAVEDRLKALAHEWFRIVEDPKRDAEPAREILAQNFSLLMSGTNIKTFEGFEAWLRGPADLVRASTHIIDSFNFESTSNKTHRVTMVLSWNGILRSNGEQWISQTEHIWNVVDHEDDNFARIKKLEVQILVPFSPLDSCLLPA